ncbi:hypothetical protein LOK49_LG09G01645 [Camellia lanceoleosa]|uniref:Uncharacterized protein n=1 Tax=Camellia lanceoleosa TaxID=1840588 RepID=A0ACC0GN24_9ERIC|nr:hypothetical protein LOK49_LG09G01645 [Camellia lanceoleosa]
MESKKRMRRTIIWKRSNGSKRIQRKRDANNNNNDVDLRDARDDDDEDGIRVTSITRMVFPSGLLQLTDHHLVYLAERSTELRELSLPFG